MSRLRRIPASLRSPRRIMSSTPCTDVGCMGLMCVALCGEIQCSCKVSGVRVSLFSLGPRLPGPQDGRQQEWSKAEAERKSRTANLSSSSNCLQHHGLWLWLQPGKHMGRPLAQQAYRTLVFSHTGSCPSPPQPKCQSHVQPLGPLDPSVRSEKTLHPADAAVTASTVLYLYSVVEAELRDEGHPPMSTWLSPPPSAGVSSKARPHWHARKH